MVFKRLHQVVGTPFAPTGVAALYCEALAAAGLSRRR